MSTTRASQPSPLLPRLLGVLFLLMGLALVAGGVKLMGLGGSLYYLLAGIGLLITAGLLLAVRREALSVYGIVLLLSTLWSVMEVGLDWWQLVPRLALWFVLGLVLLLPWLRRPLTLGQPYLLGNGVLGLAVVVAGLMALASQFTNPNTLVGRLDRETAGTTSAAPQMPEGTGKPMAALSLATAIRHSSKSPRRTSASSSWPGPTAPATSLAPTTRARQRRKTPRSRSTASSTCVPRTVR